jgi:hypothetical protein
MTRPRAMYIEQDKTQGIIKVHYGKAKPIIEFYKDPVLGLLDKHFKHPTRGNVYYFRDTQNPEIHKTNGKTVNHIKKDARKRKIKEYNPQQIYSNEALKMVYVDMGQFVSSINPEGGLYTNSLATCIGVAMRNPENKHASLFHTPGCEKETIPYIQKIITSQIDLLGTHPKLEVTIASGLVNMDDEEIIDIISFAREKIEEFFFDLNIEPTMHLAESEEMISFMSINPNDGLVDIIKKSIY